MGESISSYSAPYSGHTEYRILPLFTPRLIEAQIIIFGVFTFFFLQSVIAPLSSLTAERPIVAYKKMHQIRLVLLH